MIGVTEINFIYLRPKMLDESIKNKASYLHEYFNVMTSAHHSKRPSCTKILSDIELWSIDQGDIKNYLHNNRVSFEDKKNDSKVLYNYATFQTSRL